MNDSRSKAILKAGIIPDATIEELGRWGFQFQKVPVEPDKRAVLEGIREAIESRETVEIRQTALDALAEFSTRHRRGRLYYAIRGKTTFTDVDYVRDVIGHYIIPWTDESIEDLMLDPDTYLKPVGEPRVYFDNVEDLYHGSKKVFMICTPVAGKSNGD